VDLRVVLTFASVTAAINRANRVVANRLLRAGVRVLLFPGMTHVKALVVDGIWAYLGTANFDTHSFRHNREPGLAVNAGPLVRDVEQSLFLPDVRPEWEMRQPLPVQPGDYPYEALAGLFL
jgi:cardiolipin synthase